MATPVQAAPAKGHWAAEFKWDGVRAICYWDGATWRMRSRNDLPIEHRYPELHALPRQLGRRPAVLDGEIIAADEKGTPSFPLLQRRMLLEGEKRITRLAGEIPVSYVLFDLLYLDDRDTTALPWSERREELESLNLRSPHWSISPAKVDAANEMLDVAREQRLEGLIFKRVDSPYEAGRRTKTWLKWKIVTRQEFVIGGWVPEGGTNVRRVGSIMIGYYDDAAKRLTFVGSIGSGFDSKWHEKLAPALRSLEQPSNPFSVDPRKAGQRFVKPQLVAEIEYRRWPIGADVQQGAFKGLREDKLASDVIDERTVR